MSGADFFRVEELNPYSHKSDQPDVGRARDEHRSIRVALESAGIQVVLVAPPAGCQDGVYTANWGLCRGDNVVLSSLPNMRRNEEPHAETIFRQLGKEVIKPPYRFSGQGDALPCGELLFAGSGYRTDRRMHAFLADALGYRVISLQTLPELDETGRPVTNHVTRWPDSFFYDIDLALAVIAPGLIAWCPEAFTPESQDKIHALDAVEKIEVSLEEAEQGFACNLVSSGETVIMSGHAPELQAALKAYDMQVITPEVHELAKGGGFIRCTTLTLDNE